MYRRTLIEQDICCSFCATRSTRFAVFIRFIQEPQKLVKSFQHKKYKQDFMKNFEARFNNLPKTEIHIHLEGSIRTETIVDIAREHKLNLPSYDMDELDKHVKVYDQMRDLGAVLEAFAIFQNSITSVQVVERIAWELFEDSAKQNIHLLEVRFSPDWAFHGHNLKWDECLDGLLRAKERAEREFDMAIGYIAITSRSMGPESCVRTVDWAIRHKAHLIGIDLADAEDAYPIRDFAKPVLKAQEAGMKVTVHSGENTPASAVIDTIQTVQPDRIGHGIHIIEDPNAVELVKERGITLEVNPWSNYLTNSVRTIEEHPLKKLFDLGVKVTINSDDPEVLDTNLNNEYRIAQEILGMSIDDIMACNRYAYEASFLPDVQKKRIWEKYFQD
jgi:adenosine deaminase